MQEEEKKEEKKSKVQISQELSLEKIWQKLKMFSVMCLWKNTVCFYIAF